jgi:hypothetical protein
MKWSELLKIPKWTPIDKSGLDLSEIEEDFYKISENQYCLSASYSSMSLEETPGGPFITAFLWACSEGAAKRAYLNEIESDDQVNISPPSDILPSPDKKTYKEILKGLKELGCKSVMEHSGYRIVSDGAFIHRVIESEIAAFFFRKPEHNASEIPYAIQWNLSTQKMQKMS